ncbi:zinc ribbon domain-containing protein [candidate division KSB3 bacterium]|uniref:Zinc ribbon domain-containing protein n=1 Tax=candidate division KSB3 bacterium TaxID=2044937 RepID=A0A9D5Q7W0_9BACT|nr:zinc ribbon domain-containing protein [candidate division KSB3 bacterium]MBD3327315.1 zinc ribbon domain-containing protein [candidate division KSB3 bacterium]
MPIFEYACEQCGQEFEKLVLRSAETITCPTCETPHVKKKFSVFGMKSGGTFVSSSGSSCGSCASHSCAGCHH